VVLVCFFFFFPPWSGVVFFLPCMHSVWGRWKRTVNGSYFFFLCCLFLLYALGLTISSFVVRFPMVFVFLFSLFSFFFLENGWMNEYLLTTIIINNLNGTQTFYFFCLERNKMMYIDGWEIIEI
jgi:hypothetical protein